MLKLKSDAQALLHFDKCGRGQGTIEYLVIISIVIVISLVVVGLVISQADSAQDFSKSTSKIDSLVGEGGFSISEAVLDANGDSLFLVRNNLGENIELNRVVIGGSDVSVDTQIVLGDQKLVSLESLGANCSCIEGEKQKSCTADFYYTSQSGLEKKQTIILVQECVPNTTPVNPSNVLGLGAGTLEDPFIINSCVELQGIKNNPDANYILAGDIDCSDTINWNSGLGFEPVGSVSSCTDARCSDEASCELPLGCETIWFTTTGCEGSDSLCDWDQSICEADCLGTWDWDNWYCVDPTTSITCNTSADYCTNWCGYSWFDANTCYDTTCTTQETCERTTGCGSTWNRTDFTGRINGNNYTISNLYINRISTEQVGLFGYINGGSVLNLSLSDSNILGAAFTGTIAGYAMNSNLSNVSVSGNVRGAGYTGGLIGDQESGVMEESSFSGDVNSTGNYTGGGVGYQYGGTVLNNTFEGNITSTGTYTGGVVGMKNGLSGQVGDINYCSFSGTVTSGGNYAGGFIGSLYGLAHGGTVNAIVIGKSYLGGFAGYVNSGLVQNSTFVGDVNSTANLVGGFVGALGSTGTLYKVSADANVYTSLASGTSSAGGLVGNNAGIISQSFSKGTVTSVLVGFVGGLTGYTNISTNPSITNCYSWSDVNAYSQVGGFFGKAQTQYVTNSYSIGRVTRNSSYAWGGFAGEHWSGTGTSCFWDMNTSGLTTTHNNKCVGKTTTQMKTASTFSAWDTNIWNIVEGQYPTLKWETE